jgi:uncharacterized surface protein with fasciclin (FAS1) repeats
MTSKIIAVIAAVVGVGMTVAACGSAAPSPQTAAAGDIRAALSPAHAERPAPPGGAAGRHKAVATEFSGKRTFGPGCGFLHKRGPGSKAALATSPVGAALSQAPALSELAHAIERAGLTRMLNTASALTLFAPDDAAFDALGAGNLQALLATRPDLVRVLKFHLVAGRVAPAELAKRHVFTTVAGTKLYLARFGKSLGVNNAAVTCGNIQTSNATLYVVNRVVIPGSY